MGHGFITSSFSCLDLPKIMVYLILIGIWYSMDYGRCVWARFAESEHRSLHSSLSLNWHYNIKSALQCKTSTPASHILFIYASIWGSNMYYLFCNRHWARCHESCSKYDIVILKMVANSSKSRICGEVSLVFWLNNTNENAGPRKKKPNSGKLDTTNNSFFISVARKNKIFKKWC